METLEVRYLPTYPDYVRHNGQPVYHKYLVYTRADGTQQAVRGGPSGTPSGVIEVVAGDYVPGYVDYDRTGTHASEMVLSGENLQGYWDTITDEAGRIAEVGYHYHPSLQNSNSFIDQLLGLIGIDPMGDQQYLSPGSRTGLAFLGLGSLQFSLPAGAWENLPFAEFMDPLAAGLVEAIFDLGLLAPFGS